MPATDEHAKGGLVSSIRMRLFHLGWCSFIAAMTPCAVLSKLNHTIREVGLQWI